MVSCDACNNTYVLLINIPCIAIDINTTNLTPTFTDHILESTTNCNSSIVMCNQLVLFIPISVSEYILKNTNYHLLNHMSMNVKLLITQLTIDVAIDLMSHKYKSGRIAVEEGEPSCKKRSQHFNMWPLRYHAAKPIVIKSSISH